MQAGAGTFLGLQTEGGIGGLWGKHGAIVCPVRLEVGGEVVGTAVAARHSHAAELAASGPLSQI